MLGMSTAATIAARLESTFAREGFAAPGVAALREAAQVTIRTLYRHFPSREAMVVGALRHRHNRYLERLSHISGDASERRAVLAVFDAVAGWMTDETSSGCLFAQARAAHPDSAAISEEVARYRDAVRGLLIARVASARPDLEDAERVAIADGLFLVHEGQVQASSVLGERAARDVAARAAKALLDHAS
jgi:AcrR family transcriptional regulator